MVNAYDLKESYLGVTPNFSSGAGIAQELKGMLFSYNFTKQLADNFAANYNFRFDRNANNSLRSNIKGHRLSNTVRLDYTFNEKLKLELGGDYDQRLCKKYDTYDTETDTVLSDNNMKGLELWEYSAYYQVHIDFWNFKTTLGGRYTKNELFGKNFSPRTTLLYALNTSNTLKLIYGESFKAPSLFE